MPQTNPRPELKGNIFMSIKDAVLDAYCRETYGLSLKEFLRRVSRPSRVRRRRRRK